jgi:guanylate kinase
MLKFPDGTRVRINGLPEVLTGLYAERRQANRETAEEIIRRLEEQKNFIPSADHVRREYSNALLKEYMQYLNERANGAERR